MRNRPNQLSPIERITIEKALAGKLDPHPNNQSILLERIATALERIADCAVGDSGNAHLLAAAKHVIDTHSKKYAHESCGNFEKSIIGLTAAIAEAQTQ